ncbi:hypothetical protein DFA_11168 [Cavenderia fasciculata]|uniref:EGF-like domain-containing protein n=1 Tax=Cavenderia fasciculata TaxID=261658 RepID=F4QFA0_CACFS|nr:uncharacterized protein DFA_11168 [Cavenderia fasciculata]EGG13407.1 hypothetical protein DFA_11168 [Cavenderia fasciculata]|eukprot:XP_004350111.1 hypothetical protein DFA_11168 [Cavenderia fasciculata]
MYMNSNSRIASAIFLIRQYGIPKPENQSLCESYSGSKMGARFVCDSSNTFDEKYHIVEITFTLTGIPSGNPPSLAKSFTMPALQYIELRSEEVANRSINILELLKSVKSLNIIILQGDRSISYIPGDFNNFPNLTSFFLFDYNNPLVVPHTFLNNSISLQSIIAWFPISSITVDDSLYFPSLTDYYFHSNCTAGSHHINITAKSFPNLRKLSNTTVHLNKDVTKLKLMYVFKIIVFYIRYINLICCSNRHCVIMAGHDTACHLRIGYPFSIETFIATLYSNLTYLSMQEMGLTSFSFIQAPQQLKDLYDYNNNNDNISIDTNLCQFERYLDNNDLQNFSTNLPNTLRTLSISYNYNFNGAITESFCGITSLRIDSTAISSLPSCVWCYKGTSRYDVITDLQAPPNFQCPGIYPQITINNKDNLLVTNNNIATIKGNNIGYGSYESNYTLNPTISNQELSFKYTQATPIPEIPTLVTIILDPQIVQMMMVKDDINIGQPTILQINQNNIIIKFNLDYNPYFNHTITIDNSTACTNLTNISPSQFECTTPLLSSGDHQLIVSNSYIQSQVQFTINLRSFCQQSTNNCYGNGKCTIDAYPIISSGNYNSTNNKYVELNGDFGPSIPISNHSNVSIIINSTINCVVESLSQFQINCTIDQQPSFGLASVQLKLNNDLNTTARNILYLQSPPSQPSPSPISKSSCEKNTSNCYGHGYCDDNGKCQCQHGYSDIDNCLSKYIINMTITPNTTDPTVSFDIDGIDFLFEMFSIQELNFDKNIAKELFISNYTWNVNKTATNNHTTIVNYQLNTLSSPTYQPTQVLSTISFSTQPRTVEFGGQQLFLHANSIKLEVNISKWQYSSNLSTLRVVFKTLINNNQSIKYDCTDKDISTLSFDSLSMLQYLRVVKDDIQFNGRFIDVAMSDGRPTYSQTQNISSTPINDEQSIVMIGIGFPQCQECVLDPDFSALVVNPDNSGKCNSIANSKWKIIVIAVCVSLVTISIIFVIVKVFKRKVQLKFTKRLNKSFNNLSNIATKMVPIIPKQPNTTQQPQQQQEQQINTNPVHNKISDWVNTRTHK